MKPASGSQILHGASTWFEKQDYMQHRAGLKNRKIQKPHLVQRAQILLLLFFQIFLLTAGN